MSSNHLFHLQIVGRGKAPKAEAEPIELIIVTMVVFSFLLVFVCLLATSNSMESGESSSHVGLAASVRNLSFSFYDVA